MVKDSIRAGLQHWLGYGNYLFAFSVFNVKRRQWTKHDAGFMHFVRMIPNRGTILDIGANIGITTVLLSKQLDRSQIIAFEPVPDNVQALQRVVEHYSIGKKVSIIPAALGNQQGEVRMKVPFLRKAKMQGLSHVFEQGDENDGEIITVPMQRLEDIRELENVQEIVAIKIDVENYEYEVLRGSIGILKKHRPVIYCELMKAEHREACRLLMKELGYTMQVFEKGKLTAFTQQNEINFFFIP